MSDISSILFTNKPFQLSRSITSKRYENTVNSLMRNSMNTINGLLALSSFSFPLRTYCQIFARNYFLIQTAHTHFAERARPQSSSSHEKLLLEQPHDHIVHFYVNIQNGLFECLLVSGKGSCRRRCTQGKYTEEIYDILGGRLDYI